MNRLHSRLRGLIATQLCGHVMHVVIYFTVLRRTLLILCANKMILIKRGPYNTVSSSAPSKAGHSEFKNIRITYIRSLLPNDSKTELTANGEMLLLASPPLLLQPKLAVPTPTPTPLRCLHYRHILIRRSLSGLHGATFCLRNSKASSMGLSTRQLAISTLGGGNSVPTTIKHTS